MTRHPVSEPLTGAVAGRLDDAARAVWGCSLWRVGYRFGVYSGWPEGFARGEMDEVGAAVVLGFDNGIELIVSWVTPGRFESLDVEAGPAGAFPVAGDLQFEADVSCEGGWLDVCGKALEGVSSAWAVGGQLGMESVWAVRLSFSGNTRVVIALGEVDQGLSQL